MPISDIEVELNRCREMMKAADEAYWKSQFSVAEDIYWKALKAFEHLYPGGESITVADCGQKLGDVYYFQDKFQEALPIYRRVVSLRDKIQESTPTDVITSVYKLARTLDKLGQHEEAEKQYRRAIDTAQKSLPIGHLLIINSLEAYAGFIERLKPDAKIHLELRKKAQQHRDQNNLNAEQDLVLSAAQETRTRSVHGTKSNAREPEPRSKASKGKDPKKMAFMFLLAPIALTAIYMAMSAFTAISDASMHLFPEKSVLTTLDGHKKLTFKTGTKVEVQGKSTAEFPYSTVASNPWRYIYFACRAAGRSWYTKRDNNLVDPNSVVLYPSDSPDVFTASQMKVAATTADKFCYLNSVFPTTPEEILKAEPLLAHTDVRTHKIEKPQIVSVAWNKASMSKGVQSLRKILDHATTLDWEVINPLLELPQRAPDLHPGAVVCIAVNGATPTASSFYVVGVGSNGNLLTSCDPNTTLYYWSQGSRGAECSCPLGAPILEPPHELVMSDRSDKDIKHLAQLTVGNILCLIALVWFGSQLNTQMASFGAGNSIGNVNAKVTKASQSIVIFSIFVIGYLLFTLWLMYAALTNAPL